MQLIIEKLKTVASRWNQIFMLSWLVKSIVFGGILPLSLLLIGRLLPIAKLEMLVALLWIIGSFIIGGWQWRKRYKIIDAARLIDKDIGEDVIVTAIELNSQEQQTLLSNVITKQAMQATSRYVEDVKRKLPLNYGWKHKKWTLLMSLTIIIIAALLVIPNKQNVIANERIEQKQIVEQLTEELQEMIEAVEQATVPDEEKEQLLASLAQLRDQLAEDREFSVEQAKQLAEQLEQIEQLQQDALEKQAEVEAMQQAFEQKPELSALNKALSEASKEAKEQLQQTIQQALEQMNAEERQQLQEALEQGGKQGNETMQQLADQLQSSMNEDTMEQLAAQFADQLSAEQLANLAGQLSTQLQNEMSNINNTLNNNAAQAATKETLSEAIAQAQQPQNGSNPPNSDGQSNNGEQGNQNGQNQSGNNPSDESQNGNSGQGQGIGSGQGQQNGGSGGQGAGLGSGNHATVTTPRKFAGEADPTVDNGETTGGDIVSGGSSPLAGGTQGNYSEVFSEYEREAKDSLTRSNIPDHMQGKVKQYFDAISPSSR